MILDKSKAYIMGVPPSTWTWDEGTNTWRTVDPFRRRWGWEHQYFQACAHIGIVKEETQMNEYTKKLRAAIDLYESKPLSGCETEVMRMIADRLDELAAAIWPSPYEEPEPEPEPTWPPVNGQPIWVLCHSGDVDDCMYGEFPWDGELNQGNLAPYTDEGKAWLELQAKLRAHIYKQQSELRDVKHIWCICSEGPCELWNTNPVRFYLNTLPCYATGAEAQAAYSGEWSGLWRERSW